eukprot:m.142486 g.142486  ORF g.142486 m.142486 type:complete len:789 (+) comp16159_c0_seq1:214-2580(+)
MAASPSLLAVGYLLFGWVGEAQPFQSSSSLIHGNSSSLSNKQVLFLTTRGGTIAFREQKKDTSQTQTHVWRYDVENKTYVSQEADSQLFLKSQNETAWVSDSGFVVLKADFVSTVHFYRWGTSPATSPVTVHLPAQTTSASSLFGDLLDDTLILSVLKHETTGPRAAILWLEDIASGHPRASYLYCPKSFKACNNMGRAWSVSNIAAAVYSDVIDGDGKSNRQILLFIRPSGAPAWSYVASIVDVAADSYMAYLDATMFYYHTDNELVILNLTHTLNGGNQVWLPSKPLQTRVMHDYSPDTTVVYNGFWVLEYNHYAWSLYAVYSDPPGILHVSEMSLDKPLLQAHFTRNHTLAMLLEDGSVAVTDLLPERPINPAYPIISTPARTHSTSTPSPAKPASKLTNLEQMLTIVGSVCTVLGVLLGFALRKRFQRRERIYDLAETESLLGDKDASPNGTAYADKENISVSAYSDDLTTEDTLQSLSSVVLCHSSELECRLTQASTTPTMRGLLLHDWAERATGSQASKACLEVLLQKGASIDFRQSDSLATPLLTACMNNNAATTKLLLAHGADVNVRDYLGRTPLALACCLDASAVIPVLLQAASHLITIPSDNGYLPVHWAVMACSWDTIRRMLEADPDALGRQTEHEGWGCLHFTAREGSVLTLRKLLAWNRKEGSLYVIDVDAQGLMPEDVARSHGNDECAEVLAEVLANLQGDNDAGESLAQLRDRLLRNRAMRRYRSKHPKQSKAKPSKGQAKKPTATKAGKKKRTRSRRVKMEPASDESEEDWQ